MMRRSSSRAGTRRHGGDERRPRDDAVAVARAGAAYTLELLRIDGTGGGAVALDKYLQRNPGDLDAVTCKGNLYALRSRYEESLLIVDGVLRQGPENVKAIQVQAFDLLKLDRLHQALDALNHLRMLRGVSRGLRAAHRWTAACGRAGLNCGRKVGGWRCS
jgi:hypothetical protein